MPLMKSSEGRRFSGELRIFISHTRNLTCRLVGSGNLSHEIVLLRAASSPAAFGNYLTHRLPLDRLPSVGMHLPAPKSALVPLLMASTAGAGVQQLLKDSLPPLKSPNPLCWSLEKCNSISSSGFAPAAASQAGLAQLSLSMPALGRLFQHMVSLIHLHLLPGAFLRGLTEIWGRFGALSTPAPHWDVLSCPRGCRDTTDCTHRTLTCLYGLVKTPNV